MFLWNNYQICTINLSLQQTNLSNECILLDQQVVHLTWLIVKDPILRHFVLFCENDTIKVNKIKSLWEENWSEKDWQQDFTFYVNFLSIMTKFTCKLLRNHLRSSFWFWTTQDKHHQSHNFNWVGDKDHNIWTWHQKFHFLTLSLIFPWIFHNGHYWQLSNHQIYSVWMTKMENACDHQDLQQICQVMLSIVLVLMGKCTLLWVKSWMLIVGRFDWKFVGDFSCLKLRVLF